MLPLSCFSSWGRNIPLSNGSALALRPLEESSSGVVWRQTDWHEFDLEKLSDHDGLEGTGLGCDGRRGALWSLGCGEEPPGTDDLALALSQATDREPVRAGTVGNAPADGGTKPLIGASAASCCDP